jgi:DNA replication licensing factor MCM7
MVDESDDPAPGEGRRRHNKLKYMQILQDISDRARSNILIDLNDLDAVGAT